VFDGIFVGAGWTRAMVLTMAAAMAVYGAALYLFAPLGNDGLWLAFSLLFVVRAAGQLYLLPGLVRRDLD
jgi:MATE family multidrug resistance protein